MTASTARLKDQAHAGFAFDDMVRKLRTAAAQARSLEAAQVQVLNLDAIAAQAGTHWPRVRERIQESSLNFLRGCITDDDILIPCGDGFLIIFSGGDSAELSSRCRQMQELLTAFYLGEEGLEALRASVVEKVLAPSEVAQVSAATEVEHGHKKALAHERHGVQFVPVFCVKARVIASNFCGPSYCEGGKVRWGYDAKFHSHARNSLSRYDELDAFLLGTAADGIAKLNRMNDSGAIGVSVHMSTLQNPRLMHSYLHQLAQISDGKRSRLYLKIAEIDRGAPIGSVAEWIGQLKRLVRHVAVEHHFTDREPQRFAGLGAWAVVFQLPAHAANPTRQTLDSLSARMASFARARAPAGRVFVDNFAAAPLLDRALQQGIDFATGAGFWRPGDSPRRTGPAPFPTRQSPMADREPEFEAAGSRAA